MKTLNKIILGTFIIAAIAFMSNGCTPSAMPDPPKNGFLLGDEFTVNFHDYCCDLGDT